MRSRRAAEWPPRLRLAAGAAGLEWARATLSRSGEHLTMAGQQAITAPVLDELRSISTRIDALRRQVEDAALDEPPSLDPDSE